MSRTSTLIILFLLTVSAEPRVKTARSQEGPKQDTYEYKPHIVGGIWTVESNFGGYGDPEFGTTGNPSFDYPAGFGYAYLWEGRLWVGTSVDGIAYVSQCDYGNYEWEPDDGSWDYVGPGVSQWDIVSKYHDWGAFNQGSAIGIHVTQKAYQWSVPEYADFIAYEYEIVWNKSESDVAGDKDEINLYVSWCWDDDNCEADPNTPDRWLDDMVCFDGWTGGEWRGFVHCPSPSDNYAITQSGAVEGPDGVPDQYQIYGDDANENLIASDTAVYIPRNMSYLYDEDNTEKPGSDKGEYGKCPGYLFGRFIYGPPKRNDLYFIDDEGNEARIPIVTTHQWWNWNNDPGTDENKLNYMTAKHPMSLGYKYMPIPYDVGAGEMDYRYLMTVGPYTLEAYDTLRIVYVSGIGYGMNGGTDDYYGTGERLGMRQVADYALDAYYMGSEHSDPIHPSAPDEDNHWKIPVPPEIPELHYSASEGIVRLIWSNIAEVTPDPIYGVIDFAGYRIYRSSWKPGCWGLLDSFTVAEDNIQRIYTDEDVTLGIPYYYAVTAFDTEGLESGKANYMKDEKGAEVPLYLASALGSVLDSVIVVPNPYYGSASWEAQYEDKVKFMNLPQNCRIKIFTLSGDLVWEVEHIGVNGDEDWNLICNSEIKATSGLYVYKIEQSNAKGSEVIDSKIGKLLIMR